MRPDTLKQKPLVIPIFIPHRGCPHKCAFCNQSIITNEQAMLPDRNRIRQEVDTYLQYKGTRNRVQLAFFGGTFLGLPPEETRELLGIARELVTEKKIDTVRCSTRPDTITPERLDMAAQFSLTTVELGVQSMDDQVLSTARRGHTARDTENAARLLREYGIETGMQMMVGLPGDTDVSAMETARSIAALRPAFVRIYPLMVLKHSLIHQWHTRGSYTPMPLDHCVELVAALYRIFEENGIPVIRMGLQASEILQGEDAMAAGPWHPAFGHLVFSRLMLDKTLALLETFPGAGTSRTIALGVHPASESRLRGDRNHNMKELKARYPLADFKIVRNSSLAPDDIAIPPA
ncbi:MAG: radical SAM protein [Desulfobacteraceae bacterium]|nr:radical SAM protein [Desulfobacteraceae bacterium]